MKNILLVVVLTLSLFGDDIFTKSLLTIDGTSISILFVVKFLLIFIIGFSLGWFYKHKIINSSKIDDKLSSSTKTILGNLGYYTIIFLTIITAFNSIGLNLSSLAVVAGALSVGIGFGLQNIVSNFISGIILMFEKSVKVGDYVELENGVRGTVREIRLRATIITTNEHIDVIVPNSNFIQNSVTNLTLNDEVLRLRIPFGVAYGTKFEQLENTVLKEVLEDETLPHIKKDSNLTPRIWMTAMNSSSVDFELVVWIDGENTRKVLGINSIYLIKIYETLNAHNISIPFPQLDLHIKERGL
ncbi:MAG: mechanosensitive ion channel [Arcobacteraceae bacterium]|nr:mechanosensitive ion channel [Arcobacteraceae bacterium]